MTKPFETVCVVGLGYIGLPTAAMLASRKLKVIGVDVNPRAVNAINNGEIHIVEPDLDMIVDAAVNQGYLRATFAPEEADAFIIAVPTPFKDDHIPDLSYIEEAARGIAKVLKPGNLVILESTSPVTTTEFVADLFVKERPDLTFPHQDGDAPDINIAYCPERVLPGRILLELIENDRVVGGMSPRCSKRAVSLYETFVEGTCVETTARTAEMCKLVENAYRDVNIAFANEISMICDELSVNVWDVIKHANRHPRVNILQPGPGVGGHCIAVDPWFIVWRTPELTPLIRTAREVNDAKPEWVVASILSRLKELESQGVKAPTIACFGLAFKPDIDDLRESPSLNIAETISQISTASLLAVEPNISELPASLADKCELVDQSDALARADIAVLLVDHTEFKAIDTSSFPGVIVDCRGIWARTA